MADYLPQREADLVNWSTNFNTKISATPTAFGLDAAQATAYAALHTAFRNAYTAANDPATRTPNAVQTKNDAKEVLIDGPGGIRELVKVVQAYPALTNTQRVDLRITVPDAEPTPVPPPSEPPVLAVLSTLGRTVKLQLRDMADSEKRGRPEGVAGATILMFVGEDAPVDPTLWVFCLNTTRTVVDIDVPPSLAAGAKIWFTAFWRNRRDEAGPAAVPVSARIGDTLAQAA